MRYSARLLLMFVGLLLSFGIVFAAPSPQTIQKISFTNPDKPLYVSRRNAVFTLNLKSNRTTGYSWFLSKVNRKLIRVVRQRYVAPDQKRPGEPGYEAWTFRAMGTFLTVPQVSKIKLVYMQPWNRKDKKKVVFTIFSK